jgi:hypothetical protein
VKERKIENINPKTSDNIYANIILLL